MKAVELRAIASGTTERRAMKYVIGFMMKIGIVCSGNCIGGITKGR